MPKPSIHYECDLFEWASKQKKPRRQFRFSGESLMDFDDDPFLPGALETVERMNARWKPLQDEFAEIDKERQIINNRIGQHRRRARIKINGGRRYKQRDVTALFELQDGRCGYCGMPFHELDYEVDHIVPVARGGSNDVSNILLACTPCNRSKKDKLLHEWRVWRRW